MFRTILMSAVAATALAAAPAVAQHGPGGAHGNGGSHGNAGGSAAGASLGGGSPASAALDARMNSMGPENASPTGIEHANANSVLGTSATTSTRTRGHADVDAAFPGTKREKHVNSGSLAGLSAGTTLMSNGTAVGTVQQIRTSADGTPRVVIVQSTDGRLFPIPANKLSYANGMLTTTARLNGINGGVAARTNPATGVSQGPVHASATGVAHANQHSVLAGGSVTGGALTGLTTGTAVQFNGSTVGTVSRIMTSSDGTVRRVLVTTTDGRTVSLSPRDLSVSGGVLTATTFRGG
jgi:hypothetical protein